MPNDLSANTVRNVTLTIYRGGDLYFRLTLRDRQTKTPIDLTGYSFDGAIRRRFDDATVLAPFVVDEVDLVNGVVGFGIDASVLDALEPEGGIQPALRDYPTFAFYDIYFTPPAPEDRRTRVIQGNVTLSLGAT